MKYNNYNITDERCKLNISFKDFIKIIFRKSAPCLEKGEKN